MMREYECNSQVLQKHDYIPDQDLGLAFPWQQQQPHSARGHVEFP